LSCDPRSGAEDREEWLRSITSGVDYTAIIAQVRRDVMRSSNASSTTAKELRLEQSSALSSPRAASDAIAASIMFAAGFAYLFRSWLFTGFDRVFGDEGDGEIVLATLEHWFRALRGEQRLIDPTFFYPEPGALALTDAYTLYGLPYAALRGLGLDAFASLMIVMTALCAIGYWSFLRLARKHFAVVMPWAAVGACLFAFANMNAVKLVQVQAYCAMLLPVICICALSAWSASGQRGALLAGAGGLLHALIFLTAFLTGWFFTAFLLVLAMLHPLAFGRSRTFALLREAATAKRHIVLAYALAFLLGITPFFALYLPVLLAGHRREFAEIVVNAPNALDIINVTDGNLLWGDTLRALGITGQPNRPRWEVELGYTPAVLAAIVAIIAFLARLLRLDRAADSNRHRIVILLGLGLLAFFLLQLDYGGVRPWAAVHALVPGASGVRYTFRSQIVGNLFAALIIAYGLGVLATREGAARATAYLGAVLLIFEQANVDWPATISRRAKLAWFQAIPPAPAECRAFYLVPGAEPHAKPGYEHQTDAMLFSQLRGIATVNGYSSWLPDGWDLEEPSRTGYAAAVRAWAKRKGVSGLCGLDPGRAIWTIGLPH
jgi:hypothetical protein